MILVSLHCFLCPEIQRRMASVDYASTKHIGSGKSHRSERIMFLFTPFMFYY